MSSRCDVVFCKYFENQYKRVPQNVGTYKNQNCNICETMPLVIRNISIVYDHLTTVIDLHIQFLRNQLLQNN